jgi:Ca2+-binding EF-hand superfamily protein
MTASRSAHALPFALCALLSGAGAFAQGFPSTASGRFNALDANHDGVLSKYEYDSDTAFAVMDGDHDNRLSAAELQEFLGLPEKGKAPAADRIAVADLDGDGALDDKEMRRGIEFRFRRMDTNKDGNVDLAELQAGMGVAYVRP